MPSSNPWITGNVELDVYAMLSNGFNVAHVAEMLGISVVVAIEIGERHGFEMNDDDLSD